MITPVTRSGRRSSIISLMTCAALAMTSVGIGAVDTVGDAHAAEIGQAGGFYDTTTLPTAPAGEVLRAEPADLPLTVAVPGLPRIESPLPARAERLIYQTNDVNGQPVATSGALYDSTAPWHGPGTRPTLVIGPGTQGQGDSCAPSRNIETGVGFNPRTGTPTPSYEEGFALALAAQGFRVMVIDYIGLGTPGMHTYSDRVEQAHAMIDGARAAMAHVGDAHSPVVFWGHSQGGGASAAAAELADDYAPELDLRAAYASAPPADLLAVLDHIDGSTLTGAVGYAINGMADRYPAVGDIVDRHANDAGHAALADLADLCLLDLRSHYGGHTTAEWTISGERLGEIIRREPEALRVLDHQRIGQRAPSVPVMLAGGIHDDIIPLGQVEQLARDWCEQGTPVHFRYETTPPVPGVTHGAAAVTNFGPAVQFVTDQLAGRPAPNDCARF